MRPSSSGCRPILKLRPRPGRGGFGLGRSRPTKPGRADCAFRSPGRPAPDELAGCGSSESPLNFWAADPRAGSNLVLESHRIRPLFRKNTDWMSEDRGEGGGLRSLPRGRQARRAGEQAGVPFCFSQTGSRACGPSFLLTTLGRLVDATTRSRAPAACPPPPAPSQLAAALGRARPPGPGALGPLTPRAAWSPRASQKGLHSPNQSSRKITSGARTAHLRALPEAMAVRPFSATRTQLRVASDGRRGPSPPPSPPRSPPRLASPGSAPVWASLSSFQRTRSDPGLACCSASTRSAQRSPPPKVACVFTTRFILVPPAPVLGVFGT